MKEFSPTIFGGWFLRKTDLKGKKARNSRADSAAQNRGYGSTLFSLALNRTTEASRNIFQFTYQRSYAI